MQKVCFKCNEEKPLTEFYKHKEMADGHLNKCKECAKKDVRKDREVSENARAYDRKRYHTNPIRNEYQAKQRVEWAQNNKERLAAIKGEWIKKNPEKYKAHTMVHNAVRDGKMMKMPCEKCGNIKAQAHHHDYTKPLDVAWLCSKHHAEEHVRMRNEAKF